MISAVIINIARLSAKIGDWYRSVTRNSALQQHSWKYAAARHAIACALNVDESELTLDCSLVDFRYAVAMRLAEYAIPINPDRIETVADVLNWVGEIIEDDIAFG